MTIAYTSEGLFPLLDTGASNWGAVENGVLTSLDAGFVMTFIAEEVLIQYESVYISSTGKVSKADADVITKRPCIGITLTAAGIGASVKVQKFGWIDYNDTALGGALGATANNYIYLSSTAGRLTVTPVSSYPQPIGIAKTTTAAHITRIFLCPDLYVIPTIFDGSTGLVTLTGKLLVDLDNTGAGGANCIYADAIQVTNPLTGTLRAGYFVATNGPFASTGTIRGIEVKARAALSDLTGGNITTLEGASIDADAKNKTVVTFRGMEVILDGQSGAAVTLAVGLRISQNFQANIATTSYGLHIYRDSFDYTADILLSSGGTIGGLTGGLKVSSAGYVGIGLASGIAATGPVDILSIRGSASGAMALSIQDQTGPMRVAFETYSDTATNCSQFYVRHARGTIAVPTVVQDGDKLGSFIFSGYSAVNSAWKIAAQFEAKADGEWDTAGDTSDCPGKLVFSTVPDGSSTSTIRMTIKNSGKTGIGTEVPNELLEVAGKIRALTAFNLNGTDGISSVLTLDDGANWRITMTFAGGILTAKTTAASSGATATWS